MLFDWDFKFIAKKKIDSYRPNCITKKPYEYKTF